jgi:ribosomal-protein-alanine N-acetyltransferase
VISVRTATPTDLDAIAALEAAALAGDAWSRGLIEEGLAKALPTIHYLVAAEEDAVVGHAVVSCAGDIAELQRIAVDGGHRRRGIAGRLLDEVVALVRSTEAERLLLEVRVDNQGARAFYLDAGFEEIGERMRYYADGAAAVIYALGIESLAN